MSSKSDAREALASLINGIKNTFQHFDRAPRRRAWEAIQTGKGREEINKLLNNPSHQVVGVPRLLKFKEWINREDHAS